MSMFTCEICDKLLDGDYVEAWEWDEGEVCIDCFAENTPEDYEDWTASNMTKPIPVRNHDWEIVHKDYDGPDDPRAFTGPSLIDVWAQVIEYNGDK